MEALDTRISLLEARRAAVKSKNFPGRGSLISYSGPALGGGRRILHITPYIYFEKGYEYLGSTKDIDGRQQYLWQCGAPFDTFSHLKDQFTLADELSYFHLPDYSHIILDLSRTKADLAYLKQRWPAARLIVRSHNPELPHRIDYLRAAERIGLGFDARKPVIANIPIFTQRERGIARHADAILHIETSKTAGYWRSLGFGGDIHVTPYFVSDYYLRKAPRGVRRKPQILCVGSSHPGALITEMMINYHEAVAALGDRHPQFGFYATGNAPVTKRKEIISPRVVHLGIVDDLPALTAECFAIAVLTDLGRGFKTKILDAIMCGAWVIVTPALLRRMPEPLKPYCVSFNRSDPGNSLAAAVNELGVREWPSGDPNAALRRHAYRSLDAAIFGGQQDKQAFAAAVFQEELSTGSAP